MRRGEAEGQRWDEREKKNKRMRVKRGGMQRLGEEGKWRKGDKMQKRGRKDESRIEAWRRPGVYK